MSIEFVCPQCGKAPPKDKKLSNENWNVVDTKCPKCGVPLKIRVT